MTEFEPKVGGRVLIVDDEPSNIQIMTSVLSAAGYLVDSALDGRQALHLMADFNPHAVLLDLMMPGRDGFELCRLIRLNPKLSRTSVVIVTGRQDVEAMQRGLECGASDFIVKPWKPEDLVLRVRSAVALRRSAEDLEIAYQEIDRLKEQVRSLEGERDESAETVPLPR